VRRAVEDRRAVDAPRHADAEHVGDRGQDVLGSNVPVGDAAGVLEGALDEKRSVGDVLDRRRGRQVPARVVEEALAVVGCDHDQRPVVEVFLVQAA
jgi:hypothetical protein